MSALPMSSPVLDAEREKSMLGFNRTSKFVAIVGVVVVLGSCSQPDAEMEQSGEAGVECDSLTSVSLTDAMVESGEMVQAGTELSLPGVDEPLASPETFCRVRGQATPVPGSLINFEVWLPTAWNGRAHMVGNGGYSSAIRYELLADRVGRGDAAIATDTGHTGDSEAFGNDNVEAQNDWGHRAVHETVTAAKATIAAHYGRSADYSYFSGCSTGGQQALMEAQRYPEDFDGIIAGAPGNNRTNLNLAFMWQFLRNHNPGDNETEVLDEADLENVNRRFVERFDKVDGVVDGIVNDPSRVSFDVTELSTPDETGWSLTDRQIEALQSMYAGPVRSGSGEVLYQGWPAGSEWVDDEQDGPSGWHDYWANPKKPTEPQRADFFRHWAFEDPNWDWWSFDWDSDVDAARAEMGPIVDAIDPDLSRFEAGGGRLLMFNGWQDPVVSARDTIAYYERVAASSGSLGAAQEFVRLFPVPGMGHCSGGPGATNFSSSIRDSSPLQDDAEHDMSRAMERWVEEGIAPDRIVAAHYDGDGEATFTRPLCVYPRTATFVAGDTADDKSFECN